MCIRDSLIWRAVEGDISAGDFVLYFSSISGFSAWFSGILSGWSSIHNTSLELCDYRAFLEIPDKFNHGKGVPIPSNGKPLEIRLENVSFIYPKAEAPTLKKMCIRDRYYTLLYDQYLVFIRSTLP